MRVNTSTAKKMEVRERGGKTASFVLNRNLKVGSLTALKDNGTRAARSLRRETWLMGKKKGCNGLGGRMANYTIITKPETVEFLV